MRRRPKQENEIRKKEIKLNENKEKILKIIIKKTKQNKNKRN